VVTGGVQGLEKKSTPITPKVFFWGTGPTWGNYETKAS